jgi:hypothetical protein
LGSQAPTQPLSLLLLTSGEWPSPISSELIVSKTIKLSTPSASSDGIFWLEGRPSEQGRQVLVTEGPGLRDITPGVESKLNVRTRVHGEGGGVGWGGGGKELRVAG